MGGAQATAPDLKHIGPIDPDASTLNQFLNRWPYARLRMFSWTAERLRLTATTLLKTMIDPHTPASVKVRAAEAIFNHAAKAIEIEDIEARVSELERATEVSKRGQG
jgi:hypothetical protein